jgi:DHA2 family multidrug resistance protein
VATAMTLLYIRDPGYQRRPAGMDWPGIAFLVAGVGALQVVLERGDQEGWTDSAYISALMAVAVAGIVAFIWRELVHEHPVVNLHLMRNRTFAVGMLFNFILGFGLFGSVFVIPVFAQSFLGFTATDTGELLIPGSLATAVMMPVIGKLLQKKYPPHLFSGLGFFLFFCSTWMLSRMGPESGAGTFFWPLVVRGVGLGLIFIPLTTLTLVDLEGRDIPQGTGLSNMIRQLGGSFGVALMATFIERRTAFHRAVLADHVDAYAYGAQQRFRGLIQMFLSKGDALDLAREKALAMLNGAVSRQAALLSFLDTFYVIGFFFLVCIPLLLLFKSPKRRRGPAHIDMAME